MSQPDIDAVDKGYGSVTQQIQEQSAKYGVDAGLSGYAALTRLKELDIPSEWVRTSINVICELNPKVKLDDDLNVGFMPMSAVPKEFHGKPEYEIKKWHNVKTGYTQFKDGDALFAKITPCFENGKACVIEQFPNGWGTGSTEFYVLRPINQCIHPKLLLALVKTREFLMTGAVNMTGSVGHKRVSKEFVENYPLPFPPIAEQQQIAAKLDELLAQVDTLKTRLDTIPKILKRFRQSVLSAAVSGKLTEDWRDNNSEQIYSKGIDVIAQDANAKNELIKKHPELAKKKSSLQSDIDDSYIFEIPNDWSFSSWGKISEWITYGFTRPMPNTHDGKRLITAKDVQFFSINIENAGFTTDSAFESLSDKDRPQRGDLLITKDGSIGRAALIKTDEKFCINQSVAVCWLRSTLMNKRFLELIANSDYSQRFVKDKAQGMAIQHLSIIDFAKCPVPVPSLEEQAEIVNRIEQLFTYADQIEQRVKDAQSRVNHLTQSILAKAFRGELTAEWRERNPDLISGENSAEALLARIRAERKTIAATNKIGRKAKA